MGTIDDRERRLGRILDALGEALTESERDEIEMFLSACEYGVALETLCDILIEEARSLPKSVFAEIVELAELMGIRDVVVTNELCRLVP